MVIEDPAFWRAGAISTTVVTVIVLGFLTVDSLNATAAGGRHVPDYTVINHRIGYGYNWARRMDVPVIGGPQPLFGKTYTGKQAHTLMRKGKLVIQSRACMDCHTFFGNGSYYGPDLTKAWLDPAWEKIWMPMTGADSREEAMVQFLMHPQRYPSWSREMPNVHLDRGEAQAVVAYLKWMSAVDTNGFPANFGMAQKQ